MIKLFNDIIDLGNEMDPLVLTILNVLVMVHLCAFAVLLVIVIRNMSKSEQQLFRE